MVWETWVQSQVELYQRLQKWYLIPPCLTLSNIRHISRVKWSNPGKGVVPSPTPQCSSYWKGSLWVVLDYGRQLYSTILFKTIHSILPFPKKGDLGIAKNYRGIYLTFIAVKIYHALIWNRIEPIIEKILRKNQNGLCRNRSMTSQILTNHQILEDVHAKNLKATVLFVDFSKAFDSIHWGKMEEILLTYGLPKETVTDIMMLYKNTKVKVCSLNGNTDYFNFVASVQQGNILAPYLIIICLDYMLQMSIDLMKENGFKLEKERSRWCPAQNITNADNADDIALLGKYTNSSQIPDTKSRTGSRWHRPLCQCRQNRIHVL